MGIVRVPGAVGGACSIIAAFKPSGKGDELNSTRTFGIITVDSACFYGFGNRLSTNILNINYKL
ncbi:hypothetical protein KRR40_30035 [Niabella defluvii]|nr:hypothetical protein KRR40_30035 [Niabella sp. I65]